MSDVATEGPLHGEYGQWEIALAARYPRALSEMRHPSAPLDTLEASAIAHWGVECNPGWRPIVVALLERLESEIEALPIDRRDRYRVVQIREKSGRLAVSLASEPTVAMRALIDEASDRSTKVCELCGKPGELAERRVLWSVRCQDHEDWLPWNRPPA